MSDPLAILGPEQSSLDAGLADGGLPPLPGVCSYGVFRGSRDTKPDRLGYSYHHHVDMAAWKGKLYAGWNTCLKDEDLWPSRELLSVSDDGINWSDPVEMFPQGVSTPLRMYFFLAPNRRMLIIAGLRPDESETKEDNKRGLVVRELRADHTFGDVFTLQPQGTVTRGPIFETAADAGFVDACRALLADRVYLEQQDRGTLLGERGMKWHQARNWPGGVLPGTKEGEEDVKWTFGKALSFYRRPDKTIVGICKMGWTTVSTDEGNTWSAPVVPPTLITGKAKVFAQNHRDGSISLAYNPSTSQRYPLAIVRSQDGVNFDGMRIVQGELPRQRYEGRFRSIGPQYVRGLSQWSDDGSRDERCTWLVYSMNKEDIWVSRVPLPILPDIDADVAPGWNVYRPKWSQVHSDGDVLTLSCSDPYDYASATLVFGSRRKASLAMSLTVDAVPRDCISLDLQSTFGATRPVQITFAPGGTIELNEQHAGHFTIGTPFSLRIEVDCAAQRVLLAVNEDSPVTQLPLLGTPTDIHRLTIRTGAYRNVGGKNPVGPGTDVPVDPVAVTVHSLALE